MRPSPLSICHSIVEKVPTFEREKRTVIGTMPPAEDVYVRVTDLEYFIDLLTTIHVFCVDQTNYHRASEANICYLSSQKMSLFQRHPTSCLEFKKNCNCWDCPLKIVRCEIELEREENKKYGYSETRQTPQKKSYCWLLDLSVSKFGSEKGI